MRILVTGATGFVGQALCRRLLATGHGVRAAVWAEERNPAVVDGCETILVGSLGPKTDWSAALPGIDAVIHLAARVHVTNDTAADSLAEYRRVNTEGTRRLAEATSAAGVRRLVAVSTVKVNGEETASPYRESDPPRPEDPYGQSKFEAEKALLGIAERTGLETVILRPPLVYGPGVRANFLKLMQFVRRGLPLPLGSIRNRRSLVYVSNLADALALCAEHPAAAGKTYLVSDGEDVSTCELARRLAAALRRPSRVFPFPVWGLRLAGTLTGRSAAVGRLAGSLAVDSSRLRQELGWKPPFTMDQGLRETGRWFLEHRARG